MLKETREIDLEAALAALGRRVRATPVPAGTVAAARLAMTPAAGTRRLGPALFAATLLAGLARLFQPSPWPGLTAVRWLLMLLALGAATLCLFYPGLVARLDGRLARVAGGRSVAADYPELLICRVQGGWFVLLAFFLGRL